MKLKVAVLALALCGIAPHGHTEEAPPFIGDLDPEDECDGPVASPVCAYKTWFYCRLADDDQMCAYVMGQGRKQEWKDEPWSMPLSELMQGTIDVTGYAFVGTHKVTAERVGANPSKEARRLIGSTEVMDTYGDPQDPGTAYVGSEFYAETKPGQWRIVGWTLTTEGADADPPCSLPEEKNDPLCKIYVGEIPSWADLMRDGKLK